MQTEMSPTADQRNERNAILLEEYKLAVTRMDQYESRVIQIISIGATVLGASIGLISLVISPNQTIPVEIYWMAPLPFIVFFALLIYTLYSSTNLVWISRILSQCINKSLPEPALISFEPGLPSSIFFSSRHGNPKQRVVPALLLGISLVLFVIVSMVSWNAIYQTSHLSGTLFLFTYAVFLIIELTAFTGINRDLPTAYRHLSDEIKFTGRISVDFESPVKVFDSKAIMAFLIPRPRNLLANSPGYWIGFLAALIIAGIQSSQVELAYRLFYDPIAWSSPSTPPGWTILAIAAIYFLVEEGLLQQAKHMWDDIRDIERDKLLLQNKDRPITTGLLSVDSATKQMVVRWGLALVLGYLLGGVVLLAVFLMVSLHQVIYVLGKPKGERHPVGILFFIAMSVPLRFPTGVMAVTGSEWSTNPVWLQSPLVLIFLLLYFLSLGAMAALWRMEAQYMLDINQRVSVRPQSGYYALRGAYWQHVGLIGAIVMGLFMSVIYVVVSSCQFQATILHDWYGYCSTNLQTVIYVQLTPVQSMLLLAGLGCIVLLFSRLVIFLLRPLQSTIMLAMRKTKQALVPLSFLSALICLFSGYTLALFAGLGFLGIGYLVQFEGLTYQEYAYNPFTRRIPAVFKAWKNYLLKADQPNFRILLAYTFSDEVLEEYPSKS